MATSDRSMNEDMRIGAVEGRLRFLRPSVCNAEMSETLARAQMLEGPAWGNMGTTYSDLDRIRAALPAAVNALPPVRVGKHEVVDPL